MWFKLLSISGSVHLYAQSMLWLRIKRVYCCKVCGSHWELTQLPVQVRTSLYLPSHLPQSMYWLQSVYFQEPPFLRNHYLTQFSVNGHGLTFPFPLPTSSLCKLPTVQHVRTDILQVPPPHSVHVIVPPPHGVHVIVPPPHSVHVIVPPPHSVHVIVPPPHGVHVIVPPPHSVHVIVPPPHGVHVIVPPPHGVHVIVPPPHSVHVIVPPPHGVHGHCTTTPRCTWSLYHHSTMYMVIVPPPHGVHGHCTTTPRCTWSLYHHPTMYMVIVPPPHGVHGHCTTTPRCTWSLYHHPTVYMSLYHHPTVYMSLYHHPTVYMVIVPPPHGVHGHCTTTPRCTWSLYHHSTMYMVIVPPPHGVHGHCTTTPRCTCHCTTTPRCTCHCMYSVAHPQKGLVLQYQLHNRVENLADVSTRCSGLLQGEEEDQSIWSKRRQGFQPCCEAGIGEPALSDA